MQKLPPHQRLTTDFPILHFGKVPEFDRRTWDFRAEGLVVPKKYAYKSV